MYYKDSSCSLCIDICPVEGALKQNDFRIELNSQTCVSCGACAGVCPSEAFQFNGFEPQNLIKAVESGEPLSCKTNLPCLASVSVEYLIGFALKARKDIILDTGHCSSCPVGSLLPEIEKKVEETNYFLEKLGVENRAVIQEIALNPPQKKNPERRDFLKNFSKAAAGLTFWALMPSFSSFEEETTDTKNIVEEKVSVKKRQFLLESLKGLSLDADQITLEEEKISFTSDKWIDNQKCTNCSVCYNVCPTGALKAGDERLKILFEPKLCIKCRVCHDVCPEDCINLEETFTLSAFLSEKKVLAQHVMIPCEECLVPFSYKGDTTLCPRCRQLEEEIRDLLQIGE